jgi:hypothetical protein
MLYPAASDRARSCDRPYAVTAIPILARHLDVGDQHVGTPLVEDVERLRLVVDHEHAQIVPVKPSR